MIDELILITKHFPFNPLATPGESFLCNEIKVLSEHAKRIWIMSTEAVHTETPKVNLPENVHAYAVSAFGTKADKLVCMAEGLTCAVHAPAFVREERAHKPLKARAYLYYFYMRGRQKYRRIRRTLEGKTLGKNILIYSYWFYDHAYAAAALKRQLASAHDVCCFSRAHRYDLYEYIHRFSGGLEYIPLRRWLLENLDEVRPCSDYGTNYLKSCYPQYGQKIRTAYIGTQDHGLNPAYRGEA